MADYIFNTGTVLKRDVYSLIKNQLISAGWTNISTNTLTDFDVFKSPGEDGNKNLIIQMRPTNATNTLSTETTDNNVMSVRLPGGYNPGVVTPVQGVYTLTVGTANVTFDGIVFSYAAAPTASQWKDANTLAPLISADPVLSYKYTATVIDNTHINITQKVKAESATAPTATGTGASITTITAGVANPGTFARTTDVWQVCNILGTATVSAKDSTTLTYRINVNKNRIICVLEAPDSLGLGPVTFYLGLPDEVYCTDSASKGVIYGTTCNATTAGNVFITDAPDEGVALTISAARIVYGTLSPKNPNAAGKYSLTEMTYGNTTEGERGKLTGIYCIPNTSIVNKDILVLGAKQYYVSVCQALGNNSFLSNVIVTQLV